MYTKSNPAYKLKSTKSILEKPSFVADIVHVHAVIGRNGFEYSGDVRLMRISCPITYASCPHVSVIGSCWNIRKTLNKFNID